MAMAVFVAGFISAALGWFSGGLLYLPNIIAVGGGLFCINHPTIAPAERIRIKQAIGMGATGWLIGWFAFLFLLIRK